MKISRFYFVSILFVVLLGYSKMQTSVPNQEVVLQFDDLQIEIEKTQSIVSTIKAHLEKLGVEGVRVYKNDLGNLNITYYSDEDVEIIKSSLLDFLLLDIDTTNELVTDSKKEKSKFPLENDIDLYLNGKLISYKIDVQEIQHSIDFHINSDGKFAIEIYKENNKYFNQKVFYGNKIANTWKSLDLLEFNKIKSKYLGISYQAVSHLTPDVRAGPITC